MMSLQLFEDGICLVLLMEMVKMYKLVLTPSKCLKLQRGHLASKLAQFELLSYKIVLRVYFAFICVCCCY